MVIQIEKEYTQLRMDSSVLFPPIKPPIYNTFTTTMHEPTTDNTTTTHPSTAAAAAATPTFGGGAFTRRSKPPQPPLYVPPGHVVFRLLCHSSRIGGLIGKSGSIIKQLQQLTNSKIRVEDPTDSGDHRVISVVSSPAIVNRIKISVDAPKNDEEENNGVPTIGDGGVDEEWFEVSAAQEGILRVFERVVEVAAEGDSVERIGGVVSCRLLVWKNQGGAVIGKGGKVVEKIRKDTGSRVKVLNLEKFSSGSLPTEEIVEIEGNLLAVKKALVLTTGRLQEFPPPEKTTYGTRPFEEESMPIPTIDRRPILAQSLMPSKPIDHSSVDHPSSLDSERISNVDPRRPQKEVAFKILCPNEHVGSIIGKGGSIIKALQFKTGASIIIGPTIAECEERLITITAIENVESEYSPAQHATILVFNRFAEADSKGSHVLARVLVPLNQVGCLLGKGGAIISEMRRVTGAGLRLIGGNQVPKCALENVEVLQITGEFVQVQDALHRMTGRLRDNMFRNSNSWMSDNNSYGRTRDPPPPLGSRLSQGISDNLNDHNSLTQSMDRLGISNNIDQPPSPSLLRPSTVSGVNQGTMDISRRLPVGIGGAQLGSGSRSAIVTNTTVEILVPDTVIGCIYGESGSHLARLRQISGAKVTVHEPRPGSSQRIVVISGTPDETQVAQSVLQAFILSGS